MFSLAEAMGDFKKQLEKGLIQRAYRGLMDYITDLKNYFKNKYPDYYVSGALYYGYMDMTYFSFIPDSLKQRHLKIAIVFVYDRFCFEVWLGGYNKQVQAQYWQMFKENGWDKYTLVADPKSVDAIMAHILVAEPDFSVPQELTAQIEQGVLKFIADIELFLNSH
ncbi:MAG: hypothetical protein LWX83_00980 [Anaerolineae bacterium]|nr:hypothetical protein [Anaerolineae bacterium]